MKITMTIEVEVDCDMWYEADEPESVRWFTEDVLGGELLLHSNEAGDTLGTVKVISMEPFA